MTGRLIGALGVALVLLGQALVADQERGPNGQVYRELLPFVGLNGVRFELIGLGHFIGMEDPSFPRAAQEELERVVLSDVREMFRVAGIAMLVSQPEPPEVRPVLAMRVGWYQLGTGPFSVRSQMNLMEAARLVRSPSDIVWSSTWGRDFYSQSAKADLASTLRHMVTGQVGEFVQLYKRAHAKLPNHLQ